MSSSPLPENADSVLSRAARIRDRDRAQLLLAVCEQQRLARRMQALSAHLRLSAQPRRARSTRPASAAD